MVSWAVTPCVACFPLEWLAAVCSTSKQPPLCWKLGDARIISCLPKGLQSPEATLSHQPIFPLMQAHRASGFALLVSSSAASQLYRGLLDHLAGPAWSGGKSTLASSNHFPLAGDPCICAVVNLVRLSVRKVTSGSQPRLLGCSSCFLHQDCAGSCGCSGCFLHQDCTGSCGAAGWVSAGPT